VAIAVRRCSGPQCDIRGVGRAALRRTSVLILLSALVSLGCAKRDWTETLTLVDVTGTWDGTVVSRSYGCPPGGCTARAVQLVLRQRGASVTGEMTGPTAVGFGGGAVEGVISGELFLFKLGKFRGEASVSGDDMSGRVDGTNLPLCPCTISLHRVGAADATRQPR
jgi:hypothetical protein